MSDRMSEIRDKIIQLLREHDEMCTKDVAKGLKLSPSTTSKYLEIFRAEGLLIKSDNRKPYIYWRLKDSNNAKPTNE